jgi:predicted neutral ceramidase superfamily lipid hydrolase
VNETGASNYVRFGSRRRKVYGASTVAVLVAIVMITVFAFVRAKDAYFAANCVSLCLCAGMSYLTLLLHRRVPVPKLLLLAGSCFFAFAVTVGNGLYIRASNGAFLPSTVNDIIYPWFIYQVCYTCILNFY